MKKYQSSNKFAQNQFIGPQFFFDFSKNLKSLIFFEKWSKWRKTDGKLNFLSWWRQPSSQNPKICYVNQKKFTFNDSESEHHWGPIFIFFFWKFRGFWVWSPLVWWKIQFSVRFPPFWPFFGKKQGLQIFGKIGNILRV